MFIPIRRRSVNCELVGYVTLKKGGNAMYVEYRCPKCDTTGHDEVHRIGEGKDDGLYTCLAC